MIIIIIIIIITGLGNIARLFCLLEKSVWGANFESFERVFKEHFLGFPSLGWVRLIVVLYISLLDMTRPL